MTLTWLISTGLINAALATLLAIVAFAVSRLVRSPALTHLLWIVVLLKLFTPPLIHAPIGLKLAILPDPVASAVASIESTDELKNSPSAPAAAAPIVAANLPLARPLSGSRGETSITPNLPIAHPHSAPRPLVAALRSYTKLAIACLPAIWLAGSATMLVFTAYRAWQFLRFIRVSGETDAALETRLAELARQTGLRSAPTLIVVQDALSPLLWGLGFSTSLIFPARLARELSPLQCDALLLHELAHYSRGDQWTRLIELLSQVAFWWHPIVWWSAREIEAAEEQCCDAWVVQHRSANRRTYAEALLAAIDFLSDQPALLPPAASGLGDVPFLKLRLMQIMRGDTAASLRPAVKFPLLVIALIVLQLGPALSTTSATSSRSPISTNLASPSGFVTPETTPPRDSAPEASTSESLRSRAAPASPLDITALRPATVITASAVSPDGKYRLERRKGDQVALVNESSGFRLSMTDHRILCASFTLDSRLFLTGHGDSQVRVWDSQTGGLVAALKGATAAVWSLDLTARDGGGFSVAAGAQDGSVLVWDLASGEELAHLAPNGVSVGCLRWSHDGQRLAICYGDFSDDDQATLVVWSPRQNAISFEAALPKPIAALTWLPGDENLFAADWTGEAVIGRLTDDAPAYRISLGKDGKQIAEAAHWSADCLLIPSWLTTQSTSGAD